jgi:rfaE bifunctional protein nucleotidyltransferase chain/domain
VTGELVVFTNGCFDILHRGHIELFRFCRQFGSVIVGLNSDLSVTRLKGPTRPINSVSDRKLILEAIRYVDRVEIFEEDTPIQLIRRLKPDLIVKGGDYSAEEVVGAAIAPVKIFNFVDGYSTTSLIRGIENQ